MEQWPLVLTDSVLLVVALGGAVLTLVRTRRVGGLAAGLAAAACGVLVTAAVFDMIWWIEIFPNALGGDDPISTAATMSKIGTLATTIMIAIGIGLLIGSTNAGRTPAVAAAPAPAQPYPPAHQQQPQHQQPQQFQHQPGAPQAQQAQHQPQHQAQQQVQQQAQPAAGWTPPQQAQPGGDWNVHSGVWSIPRGTFDGPPPDQRHPR